MSSLSTMVVSLLAPLVELSIYKEAYFRLTFAGTDFNGL